jgi:hypothetical protein
MKYRILEEVRGEERRGEEMKEMRGYEMNK